MPTAKPDTSRGFAPPIPIGPDISQPTLRAIRLDGRLDRAELSPQLHHVLLGMARLRNAVSSFRLEGERVELDRAREVLESEAPETSSERGVLQLAAAYRDLGSGRLPEFSPDGVERAHRRLFDGVLDPSTVGRFKDRPNVLTDVTGTVVRFTPSPPERVRPELRTLFDWLEKAATTHVPSVTAAIFFAEFEAIHPFLDGNGRLGRYLNIALLRRLGLQNVALVPFDTRFFRTSDQYYEMLATTNTGRSYQLWTRYYVRELAKAYEIAVRRGDLKATFARFSRPSTRAILRWALTGSAEWFHRGDFPNPDGYSGPALWAALQELVRGGVLESEGEARGRRYRIRSEFLGEVYGRLA